MASHFPDLALSHLARFVLRRAHIYRRIFYIFNFDMYVWVAFCITSLGAHICLDARGYRVFTRGVGVSRDFNSPLSPLYRHPNEAPCTSDELLAFYSAPFL